MQIYLYRAENTRLLLRQRRVLFFLEILHIVCAKSSLGIVQSTRSGVLPSAPRDWNLRRPDEESLSLVPRSL